MERQSGLSELSVISWVSTVEGWLLSGCSDVTVLLLRFYSYVVNAQDDEYLSLGLYNFTSSLEVFLSLSEVCLVPRYYGN